MPEMTPEQIVEWQGRMAEAMEAAREHLVKQGWNPHFPTEDGWFEPAHNEEPCGEARAEPPDPSIKCTRGAGHEPPHAVHLGPIGPQIISWV